MVYWMFRRVADRLEPVGCTHPYQKDIGILAQDTYIYTIPRIPGYARQRCQVRT